MRSVLLLLLAAAQARPLPQPPDISQLAAVIVSEKSSFFHGESAPLRYCLDNISPVSFEAWFASSPQRFTVVVTDDRGAIVARPSFTLMNPDELSSLHVIKPGERFCQDFELMNYVRIEKPGVYTVATTYEFVTPHVIGNGTPQPKFSGPEARATLRFLEPSKADVDTIVAATTVYSSLGSPIRPASYLDPLLDVVRSGNTTAILGIGAIPTPEATRALIGLLDDSNTAVVRNASSMLAMRMPLPLAGLGTIGGLGSDPYLAAASWRPQFSLELRVKARRLIHSSEEWIGRSGAFILASIGEPDDVADISAELTVRMSAVGIAQELTRAAEAIIGRGYAPGPPSDRAGDQIFWLLTLARGARPAGWETVLTGILEKSPRFVQNLAILRLPATVTDSVTASIGKVLETSDAELLSNACRVVQRSSLETLRDWAMNAFRTTNDEDSFRSCGYAVLQLGPRMEYYDVLLTRLSGGERIAAAALTSLLNVFAGTNGGGSTTTIPPSEARVLARSWRSFIDKHREDLDAGRKLSLDDPDATAELVPRGWTLSRDGKPNWP